MKLQFYLLFPYACENQSVTLGDEHKLRVCENSAEDKTLTQDVRQNCLIKTFKICTFQQILKLLHQHNYINGACNMNGR